MNVSQRHNHFQNWNSLSTMYNTFHFYGIGLNRSRKVYSLCNFTQSDSQNGRLVKPTLEMIYCSRGHFDLLIQSKNCLL